MLKIQRGSQLTGSSNICETVAHIIKIPTANPYSDVVAPMSEDPKLIIRVISSN